MQRTGDGAGRIHEASVKMLQHLPRRIVVAGQDPRRCVGVAGAAVRKRREAVRGRHLRFVADLLERHERLVETQQRIGNRRAHLAVFRAVEDPDAVRRESGRIVHGTQRGACAQCRHQRRHVRPAARAREAVLERARDDALCAEPGAGADDAGTGDALRVRDLVLRRHVAARGHAGNREAARQDVEARQGIARGSGRAGDEAGEERDEERAHRG